MKNGFENSFDPRRRDWSFNVDRHSPETLPNLFCSSTEVTKVDNERQMPQIRKPSRISQPLNNNVTAKVFEREIEGESTLSKVDQTKPSDSSVDGSNDGGKEKRRETVEGKPSKSAKAGDAGSVETAAKSDVPSIVIGSKYANARLDEVKSLKSSDCSAVGGGTNYPVKDKKVTFAENSAGKQSESATGFRKSYHGSKSEKSISYYPGFKSGKKGILPLPQQPELFVPAVGEIAVIDLVPDDPISACLPCLEANGTYICTPCNPRCFIIQKVRSAVTFI
ncbi:UNVERIFIED_CONTAM: hypothetical protein PYX00_001336 [Menopon gallinae]|uniref:Uncharacterized protein n=1 Tax=Menopon gallinae TaxID=328185 RepID=A0AAW2ICE6_9NEOP